MDAIFLLNQAHWGADVAGFLSATPTELHQFAMYGTEFSFNTEAAPLKWLGIYTNANLLPGTTLTVNVEYYPV